MTKQNGRKIRIFLVEDNPGDVLLLRIALQRAELDCELTIAKDGGEAMNIVQQAGKNEESSPPDLVIMDLNLPKNSGTEVVEAMRANRNFATVPVAVLSSSNAAPERARLEPFGIAQFISKPADLNEYLKVGLTLKELATNGSGKACQAWKDYDTSEGPTPED